jgi:hypothetical protein
MREKPLSELKADIWAAAIMLTVLTLGSFAVHWFM